MEAKEKKLPFGYNLDRKNFEGYLQRVKQKAVT